MGTELANLRADVTAQIKALAPKRWVFIPYQKAVEPIKVPTVMLSLQNYKRHPQAGFNPNMRQVTYELLLMEPTQDPGKSDDALDDELIDLLAAIDQIEGIDWDTAQRGLDPSAQYPAYIITITFDHNTSI